MSAPPKHRFLVALTVILSATPSLLQTAQAKASSQDKGWTKDEQTLRDQAKQYALYFEAGEANQLADMWLPDGTLTDGNGKEYRGHDAIAGMFASFFKNNTKHALSVNISSIKQIAPAVAVEEGTTKIEDNPLPSAVVHYSVVHVKRKSVWRMATATETIEYLTPAKLSDKLTDLNWLVGEWTAQGQTNPMHLKAAWVPSHNFIKCAFNEGSNATDNDIQIFGWNPRSSQINVWNFASDGGFGYGRLMRTGDNTWSERASSMQPDGTICSALYTITKLNDNSFTWQSTNRTRNNREIPDTPLVTVQRDGN